MDSSAGSFIDGLIARESERTVLLNKLQQRQTAPLLNVDALRSALRCLTPPLDEEPENEESRLLEVESLSSDNIILEVVPRNRRRGAPRPIIGLVYERQRRHKVGGIARLQFDVKQQSRLENWTEFQHYHLQLHEGLEKERDDLKKRLDVARKEAEDIGAPDFDRAAEAYQQRLGYAERKLQRHKTLLQWIEQERIAIHAGYPTSVEKDNDVRDAHQKLSERPAPVITVRKGDRRLLLFLAMSGSRKPSLGSRDKPALNYL
ncbi:hypothetical protein GJ744_010337 [Endocarpon pusillum]|uniref:Uncharacterized protein n=1 Tax=Endocarpon pusillum TaxID=364733 RepID=A0A8H7AI86_9EURO|nr:hypothetical protein GJ744_010337 [Endocarpon pusillum]